jgi:hypothetical protein
MLLLPFDGQHVWHNSRTLPKDAQKAVLLVCGLSGSSDISGSSDLFGLSRLFG